MIDQEGGSVRRVRSLGPAPPSTLRLLPASHTLREYRTATRFTRPGAHATLALDQLGRGKITAKAAEQAVEKDLLDAYQARLRDLIEDARRGIEHDFPARRAEAAAQAAGYYTILAPRYTEDRGAAAQKQAAAAFAALPEAGDDLAPALDAAEKSLDGFTAAPFTPEIQRVKLVRGRFRFLDEKLKGVATFDQVARRGRRRCHRRPVTRRCAKPGSSWRCRRWPPCRGPDLFDAAPSVRLYRPRE